MPRRRRIKPAWPKTIAGALKVFGTIGRAQTKAAATSFGKALGAPAAAKAPPRGPGEWITGFATGSAGLRRFHLFKPPGIRARQRLPLVVMLHGCGQDANGFALSTRMNRIAVKERFLLLYVEQDRRANLQGCWNWFATDSRAAYREAATVLAAIDQVCQLHPADAGRVAVAGFSAGASMAALLATRYPARFRAVAVHSGVPPGVAHSSASALRAMRGQARLSMPEVATAAWPPLLVVHGSADHVVAPNNAAAAVQLWAGMAGARPTASRVVRRGQRRPMTVTDFKHGGRTLATLCLVDGLGHAWSGGAAGQAFSDARGPDAARMIWSFVARQFAASD